MSIRKSFAKFARQVTGRIAHEDLADLTRMETHDFYDAAKKEYISATGHRQEDGQWEVRVTHGRERGIMFSNLDDILGRNLTQEVAITLLEKFEADHVNLKRCVNTTINLPLVSKVRKAL